MICAPAARPGAETTPPISMAPDETDVTQRCSPTPCRPVYPVNETDTGVIELPVVLAAVCKWLLRAFLMAIAASEKLVTPERSTFPEYVNAPKVVSKVSVRVPFILCN